MPEVIITPINITVISAFIVGIAVGLAIYRFIIMSCIRKIPSTICDYCEWERGKDKRKKSRTC